MDPITQQTVLAAAGAAKGDPVYVDDVFSTYLYDGNSSTQTITNGIDNTEKSLVWLKSRTGAGINNTLFTTFDGSRPSIALESNTTNPITNQTNGFNSMNSNGFTLGNSSTHMSLNNSGGTYASWNFKAQKGFFDCVTYNGQSNGGTYDTWITVPHNLGSTPGMVIVKCTSNAESWIVWHRSFPTSSANLHNTSPFGANYQYYFDNPAGTADANNIYVRAGQFSTGYQGYTYVAYVFAHDDASFGTDGNESIIKCGTYTASGSNGSVNLGFEPQFVLVKCASGSGAWFLFDSMRGMPVGGNDPYLRPDVSYDEYPSGNYIELTSTGFNIQNLGSTEQFIYMAIRRPHKPPEAATEVFAIDTRGGTSPTPPSFYSGFPVDFSLHRDTGTDGWNTSARLMGEKYVATSNSLQEETMPNALKLLLNYDDSEGMGTQTVTSSSEYNWMFKRAPGFMDVVTFSGTGSNLAVNHNLDAIPELILHKNRTSATNWVVSATPLYSSGKILNLSSNGGAFGGGTSFMTSTPTASQIFLGSSSSTVNDYGHNYIQYLFATLPGISKVGSYTGNGGSSSFNVDCGFTSGARFVLIKDTTSNNDWYVWDTVRGMTSSAAPYLRLNLSALQNSANYWVETQPTGFKVTTGTNADLRINVSGNTYLFLAIA